MFVRNIALVAATVGAGLAQALRINTPPQVRQCIPVNLQWMDGTAPYYLSIQPGGQLSGTPLVQFDQTDDTSYTWTPQLEAGTSITLVITDSDGEAAYTSPVTVSSGSESCLDASVTDAAASTQEVSVSGASSASGSSSGSLSGSLLSGSSIGSISAVPTATS